MQVEHLFNKKHRINIHAEHNNALFSLRLVICRYSLSKNVPTLLAQFLPLVASDEHEPCLMNYR